MITTANKLPTSRTGKGSSNARAKLPKGLGSNFYSIKPAAQRNYVDENATVAALFEADTVASAQYFDNFQRKTSTEPENRLLFALLEDAIQCFQDNVSAESGKSKKLFDDAEEWVLKEGADWIFSFRNVCELLGIDPEYLRTGLMRWKQKHDCSFRTNIANRS